MYTCGWEDCDHEMAGDALAIRRHYETVHWQDAVFLARHFVDDQVRLAGMSVQGERQLRWDGESFFPTFG